MSQHYQAFISLGQTLAKEKGLSWDIPLDDSGIAQDGVGWNLTACVGDVPPPTHYLRDLGTDSKALKVMNSERAVSNLEPLNKRQLSTGW